MDPTPDTSSHLPKAWVGLIVAIVVLAAVGWGGWRVWHAWTLQRDASATADQQHWHAVEQSLATLRNDQRANSERTRDAAATNRVLREQLLDLSQRNAALEDTVAKLADPNRHGAQALRLDEVELLLDLGQRRLMIAGDLDGSRRAYTLAANTLAGLDDPRYLSLQHTLQQERDALQVLGASPQAQLGTRLDQFNVALTQLPAEDPDAPGGTSPSWWQKALSPLIKIRPASPKVLVAASDRIAANDSLQLELSLARAALERNDTLGWRQSLARVDAWILRLWPDSAARRKQRAELAQLQQAPLRAAIPELGSTSKQLQVLREGRSQS